MHADYFPRPDYDQKPDYAEKIATSLPFNYFCHNVLNMRKNNYNDRMNIASFHDWTEKNRKQWSTSNLYQEVATLTSICSFSDPNRQIIDSWDNRPTVCHKLFQPEVTDLTKGEKHIIAGLCRNSGCILPHIDNSQGQNCLAEIKKGVSLKGRKLIGCMPPLLNQTQSTQLKGNRDSVISSWWERHSESAPPFPLRVKYFREYKSCSLFDVGRGAYFGDPDSTTSDSMTSPMYMTSSASTRGTKAPPNTPDETKNGSDEGLEDKNQKVKHLKSSRKEVKLENGKKKTHLIVYLPKTEQEEEEEAAAAVMTVRRETVTTTMGENGGIMGQNRKKNLTNISLTRNDKAKDERKQ